MGAMLRQSVLAREAKFYEGKFKENFCYLNGFCKDFNWH